MKKKKLEDRVIEIDKADYVEESGYFVVQATQLIENKRRRKNSGPYIRWKTGRYVGELPYAFVGDVVEVKVEAIRGKNMTWFRIHSAVHKNPVSLLLIERFLQKNLPGITLDRLQQILDKYGLDTLQAIQNDPNAFDFAELLPEDSDALRDKLNDMDAYEEIIKILQVNGTDCRYTYPLFQKYGMTAPRILRHDPYVPFTDEIYDFQTADKLYLKQGHAPGDLKRCRAAVYAMLQTDQKNHGNLFVRKDNLKTKLMGFLHMDTLPFTHEVLEEAICRLAKSRLIDIETSLGGEEIYLHSSYEAEQTAAENIKRVWFGEKQIAVSPDDINKYLIQGGYSLDQKQEQAVLTALTSPITIITGGPGTGKTYTTKVIVDAISALSPSAAVKLCAPTGRAKVQISEVTGRKSSTIHSLLELKKYKQENIKLKELDCDYLIVDEFSMVDMQICQYLFAAAASKTRIIILGDHNQLPSVGPGLVLRDMIEAKIFPVVTLSHVFRQDAQGKGSRIIENAHSIFAPEDQKRKLHFAKPKNPGEDFYFLEEDDPRRIQEKVVEVVEKAIKDFHVPLESIAVLTPIHGGNLGTDNLNTVLQSKLNPSEEKINCKGQELRLNDKAIHIETDYTLAVYNGEIGFITEIGDASSNALTVTYPRKAVTYPRKKLAKLDLAYAMTVHKMQGSECRLVVMPVYDNNLGKHNLYTAFTRAQKSVVLIGSKEKLCKGLQNGNDLERESNLIKRLQAQILHMTFASLDIQVSGESAGEHEQQSLFAIIPVLPVSKVTCPENVSKLAENQP